MNESSTSEIVAAILTAGLLGQSGGYGAEQAVRVFREIHGELIRPSGGASRAQPQAELHAPWR